MRECLEPSERDRPAAVVAMTKRLRLAGETMQRHGLRGAGCLTSGHRRNSVSRGIRSTESERPGRPPVPKRFSLGAREGRRSDTREARIGRPIQCLRLTIGPSDRFGPFDRDPG